MATMALNSGLWVRRLLKGGNLLLRGAVPRLKVDDGTCPEKPDHFKGGTDLMIPIYCLGGTMVVGVKSEYYLHHYAEKPLFLISCILLLFFSCGFAGRL